MSIYDSKTYMDDLKRAVQSSVGIEKLKGSSVLITGASGTIGAYLADVLIRYNADGADITVYAAGRNPRLLEERFSLANGRNLKVIWYDMMQPVEFKFDVDYIIHAAGNAHPAAFSSDPVGTVVGNIDSTYALMKYAGFHHVKRFLYVSTGEVYGRGDGAVDSFKESYAGYVDSTLPRACYPSSKRAAETLCASFYKQYGLETVIVRPCHTYGPDMTKTDNRAHVQFIRSGLRKEDIVLKSAGTQIRSYCYAGDCASAVYTALLHGRAGEAYNSANPNARCSIAEFARLVAEACGCRVVPEKTAEDAAAWQMPAARQVLNSEKLEGLGWNGRYNVADGIRHTLRALQEAAGGAAL